MNAQALSAGPSSETRRQFQHLKLRGGMSESLKPEVGAWGVGACMRFRMLLVMMFVAGAGMEWERAVSGRR